MHSLLHGLLDFRDFLWVGRGRKGRGDNAPQLDGLQGAVHLWVQVLPRSFLQLTLPIAIPLYLSADLSKSASHLKSHRCISGQGHGEISVLRVNAGLATRELNLSVFLWFPCLRQIPFSFAFAFAFSFPFSPCTSLTPPAYKLLQDLWEKIVKCM